MLVYITLPLEENPEKFCTELLTTKLVAGMNIIGPCRSLYHWQNELRHREEWVIIAQVDKKFFAQFQKAAIAIHPYETPCLVGIDIEDAYPPFLKWIKETCEARKCS